jgi:hypothetical protein
MNFWQDLTPELYIALTESDKELFGVTIETATRLLRLCYAAGLPWPSVGFQEFMYLGWGYMQEEVVICERTIYLCDPCMHYRPQKYGPEDAVLYLCTAHKAWMDL